MASFFNYFIFASSINPESTKILPHNVDFPVFK